MRQLKERITHSFTLAPLPPREIRDYLNFRLRAAGYHGPDLFGPEALRIIAEASEGLTRRINIFADKTLLAAYAGGTHTVTADHARAAVTDTQIVLTRRESPRRLAAAAALGMVLGVVIGFVAAHFVAAPYASPALAAVPMPAPARAPQTAAPVPATIPVAATITRPVQAPVATSSPTASAVPAALAPIEASSRSLGSRLAAGREVLAEASVPRFAVQLMVADAREREYIENYLAEAGRSVKSDRLFVAPAGSPESPRLGVLYGAFDERGEAGAALASLPENLKQFRPYVRSLEAVREDVRRAESR
jgi:MSHA biogenesis protein MshM